jgi:hypothetical protein
MALNENETIEKDNLVVCLKLKHLSFTKFNNYLDFAKYMIKNTMKENRCFYELIPGNASQKPYFDSEFYVSKRFAAKENALKLQCGGKWLKETL